MSGGTGGSIAADGFEPAGLPVASGSASSLALPAVAWSQLLQRQDLRLGEALEALARPLLERSQTAEQASVALAMAMVGWNVAVLPAEEAGVFVQEFIRSRLASEPRAVESFQAILVDLVQRKQDLYPQVRDVILGFELRPGPAGEKLHVVSLPR